MTDDRAARHGSYRLLAGYHRYFRRHGHIAAQARSAEQTIHHLEAISRTRALTPRETDSLYQAIRDERRRPSRREGFAQNQGA